MAIRRKAYVDTLQALVSDLPGLLLKAQANVEANQIEREKIKSSEKAAYAEVLLGNLSLQLEVSKQEMDQNKRVIDAINKEFSNTTANMPSYDNVEYSGPDAQNALDTINSSATGPYEDAIKKRGEIAVEYINNANQVEALRFASEKKVEVLRFLKANMMQNTAAIASLGGDLGMIDPADFDPYWDQTLLPELTKKGMVDTESPEGLAQIAEYKHIWKGMLAPETTRMQDAQTMQTYKSNQMTQFLNEKSLVEIEGVWDNLSKTDKQGVVAHHTKNIANVLSPIVQALGYSKVSSTIDKKIYYEQLKQSDEVASQGGEEKYWDDATIAARNEYQIAVGGIGSHIVGPLQGGAKWEKDLIHEQIGERVMKAYIAASDEQNPSEKLLMQVLEEINEFMVFEYEIAQDGRLVKSKIKDNSEQGWSYKKRNLPASDKQWLLNMLGLSEYDYNAGVLGGAVELYKWKVSKEAEMILDEFTPTGQNQDDSSMFVPNQYRDMDSVPEFNYTNTVANENINIVLTDMLSEIEDDWII